MPRRLFELLPLLWMSAALAACSLLFDTSPEQAGGGDGGSNADRDATIPCPDQVVEGLLVLDTFECGSLGDRWSEASSDALTNGCRVSSERAKDSEHSLECFTAGGLNDRAAIYLDFPAANSIRVQMDVYFETPPPQYLTFLQTIHMDLVTPHELVSMNYLEELGTPGKISFYSDDPRFEQNGEFAVDQGQWMHLDFKVRLDDADGLISFDTDVAGMSTLAADTLNADEELITRLELGISDASTSTEAQRLFIDNVQATYVP